MLIFVILKIKEPSQAGLWAGAYAIVSGPSQLVNRHPQRKRGAYSLHAAARNNCFKGCELRRTP